MRICRMISGNGSFQSALTKGMIAAVFLATGTKAELYGIGHGIQSDTFYQINTATGAATPLFNFGNAGTINTYALTYNPNTNKYLTVQVNSTTQTSLIEIDAVSQTAVAVVNGIPTTAFEGIEYSAALGGVVVSYGTSTLATGKFALLDNGYNLINNNAATGISDGDSIYVDSAGALVMMDSNNPHLGWQRNTIINPFGAITINPNGLSNPYTASDYDFAWKADESRLFLTRQTSLATVVGPNNIFAVGPYGGGTNITGIAVGPPIPEPASLLFASCAALGLTSRRRRPSFF